MIDQLTEAVVAAAQHGAPPKAWNVGPDSVIRLAEGSGHLLEGATITHWTCD